MSEEKKVQRRDFIFTASYALGAVGVGAVGAISGVSTGTGIPDAIASCSTASGKLKISTLIRKSKWLP